VHIQVDRFTKLIDAHSIANLVEDSVKKYIRAVQHVIVHLEPLMPGIQELGSSRITNERIYKKYHFQPTRY
jgi:divalent metal cation (Fe/Co/Zn/Cd) transporter